MGNHDQRQLRVWVNDSAEITVLASALPISPPLALREQPWFEAFNVTELAPLTVEDATGLGRTESDYSGRDAVVRWLHRPSGAAVIAEL